MNEIKSFFLEYWDFIKFPFTSDCEYVYEVFLWLLFFLFSLLFFPFIFLGCLLWSIFHIRIRGGKY